MAHLGGPEPVPVIGQRYERSRRLADPDDAPANASCAGAGSEMLGEVDLEQPKRPPMRSDDWRLDLDSRLSASPS